MQAAPLTPQISLTQLTQGRNEFIQRYTVEGRTGFAPDIKLSWPTLKDAVENKGGIANIQEIVLRLIHRLVDGMWFLTMECCQLDMSNGKIVLYGNRFDLTNNGITPSSFKGDFDEVYFSNVLCEGKPINIQTFVHNITFPWYQQIAEMHCQNELPDNDDTIFIKFTSCSYDYSAHPDRSLVQWPHIVLFLMNATDHGDYVDDADYTNMFTNRAGDMGTLCPPRGGNYEWPATLPTVNICMQSPN